METCAGSNFITIVMPSLNEENFIRPAIDSLLQSITSENYELIVSDGGSTDKTQIIVKELSATNPRIKLIQNQKRSQSSGVNLAVSQADRRSRVIVRADCHSIYPPFFVERCVESLRCHDAASVVVPMQTIGLDCMQKAIAAAQNSLLGNGGARHRNAGRPGYVDHGHHAAFDRKAFEELGGYDEGISHNEDVDYDIRLIRTGRRIWLDSRNGIVYYPRKNLFSLGRQYFFYGRGRWMTFLKHGVRLKLRQLIPLLIWVVCFFGFAATFLFSWAALAPVLYMVGVLGWGLWLGLREKSRCESLAGLAAVVMHLSWATGFLWGWATTRTVNAAR